ncbi:MAG TPA: hypothetical protein VMI54_00630 [Polyangiaceae bacterium]|nr:hypothetical protein [Polyangiaceae bacterium]
MISRRFAWAVGVGALILGPRTARAGDATLAEALFQDGKKLMEARDYEHACPKFKASYDADPATGTLFALASCEEDLGLFATAWTDYLDVAARSKQEGRLDRAQAATDQATLVAPRLDKITVHVAAETAALPGFVVKRNGVPMAAAAWDTPIPVDPGPQEVEANATGKEPFHTIVKFGQQADQQVIDVVFKDAVPDRVLPPVAASGESTSRPPYRPIGYVTGGVGIAAVAAGAVFGVLAKQKDSDSKANGHCDASGCDAKGLDLNKDARTFGNLSTAFFIGGGVLLAAGVTLFVVGAPGSPESRASITLTPLVARDGAALSLAGRL